MENLDKDKILKEIDKEGLVGIIKYEGDNSTFIWKHPTENFRYGSQLIVHESQEAIFFKDGQALDLFGPGRYTLETQQLPLLGKLFKATAGNESVFHTEVYFINKTVQMALKWGIPEKIRFIDPLTGTPLDIGASGAMNLEVSNSRKLLLKLVGTMRGISWDDEKGFSKSLQESFRPLISSTVKTNLPAVIKNENIDLFEIDSKLDIISSQLLEKILPGFEEYGLTIPQFYVTNIVLPEDDPNFKRIRELHTITLQTRMFQADAVIKTAQAQSEAQYKIAQEQGHAQVEAAHRGVELERQTTETEIAKREAERKIIAAQAEAQAQKIAGFTEAEVMQVQGYNKKDIIQADVQKAYAAGLGNMGSSGGGSGLVSDMVGLSVGMAAAGTVVPQINGMMQGFNVGTTNQSLPTWDCTCGNKNVVGNFCNMCGKPRPAAPMPETWDCICGQKGVIGNFCNNCGRKRGE